MNGRFGMKYNPQDIRDARKFLDETKQSLIHYERKDKEITEQLEYVKKRAEGIAKARIIIQTVAQQTQKNLEYHLPKLARVEQKVTVEQDIPQETKDAMSKLINEV